MSEEAERLFERARELSPEARAAAVEESCRDDPRLRDELLSLLEEADAAETFFQQFGDALLSGRLPIHEPADRGDEPAPAWNPSLSHAEPGAGTSVGHYRILSLIGRGGMGAVYRAEDTVLERQVALKFLPPLSTRLDDEERLLKEARSAAALEHPNICTIHEIGQTDDGRPFIAMALHEGQTLKEKLEKGPLSPGAAVATALQIARGLEAAHSRGILHRDVKPANVILGVDGNARLVDFGLATVVDATVAQGRANPGTLAYMSPEQIRGDSLDPRTDLWSLGVVLYEMLSGSRPFRGGGEHLVHSIVDEDPRPLARHTAVPASLARVVDRLLSKDPAGRYGSAADVITDLTGALQAETARASGSRGRRRGLVAATVGGLVTLVAIAFWLPERPDRPAPGIQAATGASIAVLPIANLSGDPADKALADGMTEELIAILARTEGLRVVGSTSVFAFQGRTGDVRGIADSLGVSHILEGGLQKMGSRLRVRVRLVDPRDGTTRWSQTYDREFEDIFAVQDDIALAVAGELRLRVDPIRDRPAPGRGSASVAAYELYLRGMDPTLTRTDEGVREAREYFQQALAIDSTYAAAYAQLALVHLRLGMAAEPEMPLSRLYGLADRAARTAVALDDSLSEAHQALGRVRMDMLDFPSAEAEIGRAIALDPTRSTNHLALARLHLWAGRPAEALAEARLALETDPLAPIAHALVAEALFANRRYDEALAQLDRIEAVRPPPRRAMAVAGLCYAAKRMWPEAIAALRPHADGGDPLMMALLGHTLAHAGQREEAERILAELLARWDRTSAGAFEIAIVHAGLGRFDEAFRWLDESIDDYSAKVEIMAPTFVDLHRDPRFERFTSRLGLQKL